MAAHPSTSSTKKESSATFSIHAMALFDIPPYMGGGGGLFQIRGVNPRFSTPALERAHEIVWNSGLAIADALRGLEKETAPEVVELVAFLRRPAASTPLGTSRERADE